MTPTSRAQATQAAAEPSLSQEQLSALVDQMVARALPLLLEELAVPRQSLELGTVDVEGLLACTASDNVDKVIPALFRARREFAKLTKNRENPHFGSSYADLAQVLAVSEEGLFEHNLLLDQSTIYLKWAGSLEMFLQTRLYEIESMQWLQAWWWVDPPRRDPQGFGAAMTYGRRYPAQTKLGLAGTDDDGNAAGRRPDRQQQAPPPPPPPPPVEVSAEEEHKLGTEVAALADVDAVRAKWVELRDKGQLTEALKAALNDRAGELVQAAKDRQAQASAEQGDQPADQPTEPSGGENGR